MPRMPGPRVAESSSPEKFDLVPHHHAGRALEDLHVDLPAPDPDHLGLEGHPLAVHIGHLVLENLLTLLHLSRSPGDRSPR